MSASRAEYLALQAELIRKGPREPMSLFATLSLPAMRLYGRVVLVIGMLLGLALLTRKLRFTAVMLTVMAAWTTAAHAGRGADGAPSYSTPYATTTQELSANEAFNRRVQELDEDATEPDEPVARAVDIPRLQADVKAALHGTEFWIVRAPSPAVRPVRSPPSSFVALSLRAVRLYGMFVFVIGLLLCQALLTPYLLRASLRRPRA